MKTIGRIKLYGVCFFLWLCAGVVYNGTFAQTYVPLTVSGFTQDVIAEAGTDATAVTSTVIDATLHVMYSANFAAVNGSLPGGVVDNGTIVNGNYTWQMAPFTGNNALYLSRGGLVANTAAGGTLTLASPASLSGISLLLFSTEGNNTANVVLTFTDGTTANGGNFLITDWYDNPNPVYNAFGRIVLKSAPAYTSDGVSAGNGRMYKLDVSVPCASRSKLLQSVTVNYVSGTLSGRVLVFAISGAAYSPLVITPTITDVTCNNSNGSISLNLSVTDYFFRWSTTPQQYLPGISGLAAGPYTCTITDMGNCVTTWQGTVNTVPLAQVSATASPASVCPGGTTTITASSTGPTVSGYTWSPGGQSGNSISVSPASATNYTVSGQDANGCTVSGTVSVGVNPVPRAAFTATDTICEGSAATIQFTGSASGTALYDWNNFAGATVQSGSGAGPYTIVFNTPGTYPLQLQVNDGCPSAIATWQVVVSAKPVPDFSISPVPVCSGDAVAILFTGTTPYATTTASWNWGSGTVKSGSGAGPYSVQYNATSSIRLTMKNGGCTVSVTKAVAVQAAPVADFDALPPSGCVPLNVRFTNKSKNADTYTWTFGDGNSSNSTNPPYIYTGTGSYTVTLLASKGACSNKITKTNFITVSSHPVPAFYGTPDTAVEVHVANFNFFNQSQNAGSYLWDFGDGDSSSLTNPGHKYNAPGEYTVILYATNGACTDTVSHGLYKVIPDKVLIVPNAFSPNGDGINDRWDIDGLKGMTGCTVSVFNRWGQEVFKSQGYQYPWDGKMKGQPVPMATYYYVITVPGKKPYSGWVVVLK